MVVNDDSWIIVTVNVTVFRLLNDKCFCCIETGSLDLMCEQCLISITHWLHSCVPWPAEVASSWMTSECQKNIFN